MRLRRRLSLRPALGRESARRVFAGLRRVRLMRETARQQGLDVESRLRRLPDRARLPRHVRQARPDPARLALPLPLRAALPPHLCHHRPHPQGPRLPDHLQPARAAHQPREAGRYDSGRVQREPGSAFCRGAEESEDEAGVGGVRLRGAGRDLAGWTHPCRCIFFREAAC
jgi:hypothetical protein